VGAAWEGSGLGPGETTLAEIVGEAEKTGGNPGGRDAKIEGVHHLDISFELSALIPIKERLP
jgi:hypothetical protein